MRINFIYCGLFVLILVVFCVVSSFTTFRLNFTSGLLQVILPRPQIGMLSLVTVSPVITAFHSCCLSYHVFDQVNLWPAWVGFETAILRLRNLISKWFQLKTTLFYVLTVTFKCSSFRNSSSKSSYLEFFSIFQFSSTVRYKGHICYYKDFLWLVPTNLCS